MLESVEWGEFKLGDLFHIDNTLSFNKDKLTPGSDFDYVTRTSQNQGILQQTGFVNTENINQPGVWSLGLLQMDFFYRHKPWYAGQFVRKVTPKENLIQNLSKKVILYFTATLNNQKNTLLSFLVRDIDEAFKSLPISLPVVDDRINFHFMERLIERIELERIAELEAYLTASGLKDYQLTPEEKMALDDLGSGKIVWGEFAFKDVFGHIAQGRRVKKDDQLPGDIPFVMAGATNMGVANHISNPISRFPKNSITVDIFGNTFYRNYDFGAGDDTGVYWSSEKNYSRESMLFFTASMAEALKGRFDYGNKLRSSNSLDTKMKLPVQEGQPALRVMEDIISAVQKLVVKDLVLYTDKRTP